MGRRDSSDDDRDRAGGTPKTTLQVSNLTRNCKEDHLKEIFGNFGKVMAVHLAIDKEVALPKGYGYVDYEHKEEADAALVSMNGGQIDGNVIKIEFVFIPTGKEKPKEKEPPKKTRGRSRSRDDKKRPAKKHARRNSSSSSSGSSSSSPSPPPRKKR
jgi:RNA-binding protein with serine-rich domain 1